MITQPTDEEKQIEAEHIAYMQQLVDDGVGIFGGAVQVQDSRQLGLFIFEAEDDDKAQTIVDDDPAVKARIMRGSLYPYRVALWNADAIRREDDQQHYQNSP